MGRTKIVPIGGEWPLIGAKSKGCGSPIRLMVAMTCALIVACGLLYAHAPLTAYADEAVQAEVSEQQATSGEDAGKASDSAIEETETSGEQASVEGTSDGESADSAESAQANSAEDEPAAVAGSYSGQCSATGTYWVLAGESITISGSSSYSSNSNYLTHFSGSSTWRAGSSMDRPVAVTLSRRNSSTKIYVVIIPRTASVKTYARYANDVPYTLTSYATGLYGPGGDNTGYNTMTVDIAALLDNGAVPYVTTGGAVYFSFESERGGNLGGTDDARKTQAQEYWNTIKVGFKESDLQDLASHFSGLDDYYGYVLKCELSDGASWHLDGALKKNPPVYMVEVYENGAQRFSSINDDGNEVVYSSFVESLEDYLDADAGSLTLTQDADGRSATLSYTRDGVGYTRTLGPLSGDVTSGSSAIYVNREKFGYYSADDKGYYNICRLTLGEEQQTSGTLRLSKDVAGGAADATAHFEFTISGSVADGSYAAEFSGVKTGDSHEKTVEFKDGKATVSLCDGESVVIGGLPAGAKLSIVETVSGNAKTSTTATVDGTTSTVFKEGATGTTTDPVALTIANGKTSTVSFTNTAELVPQTGISLSDIAPMAGLLTVAVAGAGALAVGRKRGDHAWKE